MVASRVPDVRFLIDHLLSGAWESEAGIDSSQIGLVGHSFGGWTVLAVPEVDPRVRAVVALAPGGNSNPRPGILRATLTFDWGHDVPTLYLVADRDTPLPLNGMYELFDRTRSTKQMVILRRADHLHFMDNVEQEHEAARMMPFSGEYAYLSKEMRPIEELSSGAQAHLFVRGLTLCHFDAVLKNRPEARRLLSSDLEDQLARRGVEVTVHKG
jgi:predicted dienelactone hydrolase